MTDGAAGSRSAGFPSSAAIWSPVLRDDRRSQLGVGVLDPNRVLQALLIDKHYFLPPSISQGHGSLIHV